MTAVRAVAVVVPAHDEQDLVGGCLDAVVSARAELAATSPQVLVTVTVVLDACSDQTARRVRAVPGIDTVAVDLRCVGAARAAGTAHALAGLDRAPDEVWTAHTDADSLVPADWLTTMVEAAARGADAVLGTVLPDDALGPRARAVWAALHPVTDGHPYVHGANLGVRASALAAVGGWRALVTGEDVDLAARLRARPDLVVHSPVTAPVVTSSRAEARAPAGFSSFLREMTVA